MRRVLFHAGLAMVAALVLAIGLKSARAAAQDGKAKESTKVSVVYHQAGKEVEGEFDLDRTADRAKLIELLETQQLHQLIKKKEVNLLKISADLGLWTLVVFLLLFVILKKVAWGPILDGLKKREENIVGALAGARKARDEAQAIRAQLQKEMDQCSQKIAGMIDEARRDALHLKDEMIAQARTEIQTERDRLRREIDTARDQALQELFHKSVELATLISTKAVRRQLSLDDHRQLVAEALDELKTAGAARRGSNGGGHHP
jgi:F-type H+-transporting ATPase subunit b